MYTIEIWKDVKGFEGLYKVSNHGNVKSILFGPKNVNITHKEQLLRASKSSTGYLHVQLYKDGKAFTVNIHKLVAEAFIPNTNNKPEINHIDADRSNNHVSNLEWVTHSENIKHAIKIGNFNPHLISHNGKRGGYTILQYSLHGEFIKEWDCIKDISEKLNINYNLIIHCINGYKRSAAGFMWLKHYEDELIKDKIEPRSNNKVKYPKNCKLDSRTRRKIVQYNKNNELIHIWNNYLEIINDEKFGTGSIANIMKCASGKRKSAKGYIWKYI